MKDTIFAFRELTLVERTLEKVIIATQSLYITDMQGMLRR